MAWCFLILAVAQTIMAVAQWHEWLKFKSLELEYPPEILAAAHFLIPAGMMGVAVEMSACAALLWLIAIWRARE